MKRILVTGGAGFVGSNLVRELQRLHPDARILVVDDMRVGTFKNLVGDADEQFTFAGEVIARSLNDLDLFELVQGFEPDVIFHEASITDTTVMDEAVMMRDNVEPFEVLVDAALQTSAKLVWASSAATYGQEANGATRAKRPFKVEDAGKPANIYGFSKWVMENLHRQALEDFPKAHIVGLRYFNVFGPHEQNKKHMASMVYQLAVQMLAGKRPRIFAPGDQARDQVYVKDVVSCTIAGAADGAKSGIYNLGSGAVTSFNDIIDALNEALEMDCQPEYFENPYKFYQDYTCADLSQTKSGLNWSPRYSAREAIVEYGRWLKKTLS